MLPLQIEAIVKSLDLQGLFLPSDRFLNTGMCFVEIYLGPVIIA